MFPQPMMPMPTRSMPCFARCAQVCLSIPSGPIPIGVPVCLTGNLTPGTFYPQQDRFSAIFRQRATGEHAMILNTAAVLAPFAEASRPCVRPKLVKVLHVRNLQASGFWQKSPANTWRSILASDRAALPRTKPKKKLTTLLQSPDRPNIFSWAGGVLREQVGRRDRDLSAEMIAGLATVNPGGARPIGRQDLRRADADLPGRFANKALFAKAASTRTRSRWTTCSRR